MNRYDKTSGFVWLTGSVAIILGSSAYSYGSWSHPGPAFLPLWCGIVMAALSLIVFVQAVLKDRREGQKKKGDDFLAPRWPKLVAALIILLAYAVLLEFFGYLMMTFTFMLLVLKVVEPRKWRTAVLEAALATIASYSIFELWLKVLLPKGFWPRLF